MKIPSYLVCALLAFVLAGCSSDSEPDSAQNACSVIGARVFGGESCNQDARSPVVALFPVAQNGDQLEITGICTGTLVTLDDIVTSAHCFVAPLVAAGDRIRGFVAVIGGVEGDFIPLVDVALHPSYSGEAGSPFDIAIATLQRLPEPPVGPLPLLGSKSVEPGNKVTAYGYGTNSNGEVGELRAANFEISELVDRNFIVMGTGEASLCPGDSGGPLVYHMGEVSYLTGVNSFVNRGGCQNSAAEFSGFVDIQFPDILDFLLGYAPDIALQ